MRDNNSLNKLSVKRRRCSAITVDRLSQLPQPVLHNILSLLSQKDAVRTSVLSQSWRYIWHGRFNVEFRDRDHGLARKKEFLSFLDKTLPRYLDQNLSLQKILVDIYYEVDFVLLKKWIPLLIMNMGVSSFTLISYCAKPFPLPLVVFQSEFLVELHLEHCSLDILKSTNNVMLNNLQTLGIHHVYIDYITDEIFEKIISGCPLIENLDLCDCNGLKSIKLHKHHNIKDFGCSLHDKTTIIEIEDPHALESVRIENCRNWFLRHKNMHFPHLKSLNLDMVHLPAKIFDNFSSFFPCLNELILDSCDGLKEFRLLSSSIKRLTITMDPRNRIKAFIDTPNILYFKYDGFLPSIKFATTSNEWKSELSLCYKLRRSQNDDATLWFLELNELLKALSQSHITLELDSNKYKKLHINDSYGGFYKPVVVEHLKFSGCFSSSSDSAILNCFFRVCRPCYLHTDLYDGGGAKCSFTEYISKLIPDETGCFWLQDLVEVSTEVWKKAKEWCCVKGTSLPAMRSQQQIRFRLTWKEQ
ncbi:hypothetical protein CASFOL_021955 [Castilleja foliolosa]|uniref:F-box domain-containing protein n=1 Tax=Castilleja foliolosa TaxID=1961234 RepID=A0ABD3D1J2_9LAMI